MNDIVTEGVGAAVPLIERRLGLQVPLSEDDFRHLAFHGMFKAGVDVARVALEYPHPADSYKGKEIDAVILDANGVPKTAIEFKYHRKNPNPNSATTHGENAGELLADFARLRDFPNVHRFVAYLTDWEMFRYLSNPKRGLDWLFCPSEQEFSEDNIPRTKTLLKALRDKVGCALSSPVRAQMAECWDVGNDHKLFVWRVWQVG